MSINIQVKPTAGGDKIALCVAKDSLVSELKSLLEPLSSIPAAEQRVIYRGQILKDEKTIESYGIAEDHVLHLVRGKQPGAGAGGSSNGGAAPASTPPLTSGAIPPASSFGSLPSLSDPMAMLNNPQAMQEMMSSPLVQGLLSDPDMIRTMMQSNPQLQALMQSNPEMAQALSDPATMRQAMDMMRNPSLMQEQMRQMDRQLHNIEGMPEGFNRLRQMYETVQEPMMNAIQSNPAPTSASVAAPAPAVNPSDPNAAPLPNPWGGPQGGAPNPNPGSAFPGGLGGMPPDMSSLMNNPQQLSSMLNNPMMQQMMTSISRNPQLLQSMMDSNPMIRGNPAMREAMSSMMSNPALMQQMMDPSNLQAMLQMQTNMQQLQSNGLMSGFNPSMMGLMGQMQGLGAAPQVADPETTWATQIQQLQDMGFYDRASNIAALRATNGNVNLAVERLLSQF